MDRRDLITLGLAAGTMLVGTEAAALAKPRETTALPIRESILASDQTRLFVRDWGSGPPVLFLAGWTLPSDFWGYQMIALSKFGFRTLAYDRRGHGRSADPGRGYDFDTLADDLAAVIDRLKLNGVTLVGHSMASGEIARYFARHGGARVRRVVLIAPTTPFLMKTADNPLGMPRALLAASRTKLAIDFPGQVGAQIGPFFTPQTSPDTIAWVKQMMLQTSMQAIIECARALHETDFRPDLGRIHVPTLIVHGDKDASAPLPITGRRTATLIPNARLSIFEGAPHGLPLTHVERLNEELLAFVRRPHSTQGRH